VLQICIYWPGFTYLKTELWIIGAPSPENRGLIRKKNVLNIINSNLLTKIQSENIFVDE
jgi:hypothetical protein